jgi:hypothetical protein
MHISDKIKGKHSVSAADAFDKALGRALSAAMRAPLGSDEERKALGKLDYLRSCASMFSRLDALAVMP